MVYIKPRTHSADLTGLKIDGGRLRLLQVIGSGSYGVVYFALDTTSSKKAPIYYAVKCLHKGGLTEEQLVAQYNEVEMHTKANNAPHVIQLHRVVEDFDYLFLVLDLAHGGDLYDAITFNHLYHRNDLTAKTAILQLIDGLSSCHEAGVYHRDLRPENILCGPDGLDICIADFGLATECRRSYEHGTGAHISPEALGEGAQFVESYAPEKSDIWSLGILMLNILTGLAGWNRASLNDPLFVQFLCNPDSFLKEHHLSAAAANIIRGLLVLDPNARSTLQELREVVVELDTFFVTDAEISMISKVTAKYEPFPIASSSTTSSPSNYPAGKTILAAFEEDEEYIFDSPDPNTIDNFPPLPRSFTTPAHTELPINLVLAILHAEIVKDSNRSGILKYGSTDGTDSDDDSEGPITPETYPIDLKIEIPNFDENELDMSILISDDPSHHYYLPSAKSVIESPATVTPAQINSLVEACKRICL